jgi:hypothetical protein
MPMPNQTILQAMVTEQTCGDACWHARDEICRCSCGGKNHGCLRTADGEQPNRTRKLKGAMYQLMAIQNYNEEDNLNTANHIYQLERTIEQTGIDKGVFTYGDINWAEGYRMEHLPTYVKTASEGEVKRWPELSAWRDVPFMDVWNRPVTLWVRIDLLHLMPK